MLHRCKDHPALGVLRNGFSSIPTTRKAVPSHTGLGDLGAAVSALETSPQPDTFQWNAIMKAHIDAGLSETALYVFSDMREACVQPDHFTFPLINHAVSSLPGRIDLGEAIHCLGIQMGFASDAYFCNTVIEMYARCDRVSSARYLFDEMCERDVVSWTSMISGYVRSEHIRESFRLFHRMRTSGFNPSAVTLAVVLRACGVERDADGGRQLHGLAIKRGFESHDLVKNSLLTVFSKAGCLDVAAKFFGGIEKMSVVSWNIIMAGYLSTGEVSKVVDCFENMKVESVPSHETLTLIISVFAKCGCLVRGQKVHGYAVKSGQIDDVLQSSLIDFYSKCGELASSLQLFEEIEAKNSTTWSVMIWAFIHNGQFREAVGLFQRMQTAGFHPIVDTLRGLVLAYTPLGALQLGKGIHGYLIRNEFSDDPNKKSLETSILNMYVKCGSIAYARKCFDRMAARDTIAWSSMIEGYAIHGFGLEALKLFHQMQEEGIKPNSVTFLSLLCACSHAGLVIESCEVFDCMTRRFGIMPELNHYTCMVDLLARSGKLHEACELIKGMDVEPDGRIWGALLASCRIYSDGDLGALAARRLFDLEPDNVGYYVVLSNIHASDSKWDQAEDIRRLMSDKGFKKQPGWSCIEVKLVVHMFDAWDISHPQAGEIYGILGCLRGQIEDT